MALTVFKRVEQKYLVTPSEYKRIIELSSFNLKRDKYFYETICNVYFDTKNSDLINTSLEKPVYKEKVRLRSYGVVKNDEDEVFLEIKKKYRGVVNKRRIVCSYLDFLNYMKDGFISTSNKQIFKEIDYCFKFYGLSPALYLAYDRYSYKGSFDEGFRVTFDKNIRSRTSNLTLKSDDDCEYLLDKMMIMEVKALDAIPLWFIKILSTLKIYPTSFSKYGEIYKKNLGGKINV